MSWARRSRAALLGSIGSALVAGCTAGGGAVPEARPPDVLVVVLDTVRADATSAYGAARSTTPQLAALAAEGVRFSAAVAPGSWTWPVHGSLFTGRWPWEHGAHFSTGTDALQVGDHLQIGPLDPGLPTLAERLGAAGYDTALITANPIIGPGSGMERGFGQALTVASDAEAVARAAEILAVRDPAQPLLLVVNFFGAHAPYALQPATWTAPHTATLQAPPPWLAPLLLQAEGGAPAVRLFSRLTPGGLPGVLLLHRGELVLPPEATGLLRDLYDGEVMAVDYALHRLLRAWSSGDRPAVVAVTADHGELLGEGGRYDHGRLLTPELVAVPLVVSGSGIPAGVVIDAPVASHALHPTLLELAGVQPGAAGSLRPTWEVPGSAPEWPVLSAAWPDPHWVTAVGGEYAVGYRAIREEGLLLVRAESGESRLLDVSQSPAVEVTAEPALADRRSALEARLLALSPPLQDTPGGHLVSPLLEARLRELGYIE